MAKYRIAKGGDAVASIMAKNQQMAASMLSVARGKRMAYQHGMASMTPRSGSGARHGISNKA